MDIAARYRGPGRPVPVKGAGRCPWLVAAIRLAESVADADDGQAFDLRTVLVTNYYEGGTITQPVTIFPRRNPRGHQ